MVVPSHLEPFHFGHAKNLFAPTSRIPLFLKLPHQDGGEVVDEPVSLIDVGPTVLDFCGVTPPEPLPGQSLLPMRPIGAFGSERLCEAPVVPEGQSRRLG